MEKADPAATTVVVRGTVGATRTLDALRRGPRWRTVVRAAATGRPGLEVSAPGDPLDASGVVVLVDAGARPHHRAIELLVDAARSTGRAVVPLTDGAPWPQFPLDGPDRSWKRDQVATWARERRGGADVEVRAAAGPVVAVLASAVVAHAGWPDASVATIVNGVDGALVHRGAFVSSPDAPTITAAITLDRPEHTIASLTDELSWFADELLAIDTGADAGTVAIARANGWTVIPAPGRDPSQRGHEPAAAIAELARRASRGAWMLWVGDRGHVRWGDVDRRLLASKLAEGPVIDALAVPVLEISDGNIWSSDQPRLFRRSRASWVATPNGIDLVGRVSRLDVTVISHPVLASLDGDTGDDARPTDRLELARRAHADGRFDEAVAHAEAAAHTEVSDDDAVNAAAELAARSLMALCRFEEARAWATTAGPAIDALLTFATGRREPIALDDLDAEALSAEEASLVADPVAALAAYGSLVDSPAGFGAAVGLVADGEADGPLVEAVLAAAERASLVAVAAGPRVGDAIAELLFGADSSSTAAFAAAAAVAPNLPLDRALTWSARLRAAGLGARCPLAAKASQHGGEPAARALAAAVGIEAFGDLTLVPALERATSEVRTSDLEAVLVEVADIAPSAAGTFVTAAATDPARTVAIAGSLAALGARDEALIVLDLARDQAGPDLARLVDRLDDRRRAALHTLIDEPAPAAG